MPMYSKRLFSGSALLTALFIMTLVAIAATAMTLRLQLDIYKTKISIESDKYYLASQLVIFWGMNKIYDSKNLNQLKNDNAVAIFPKSLQCDYPGFIISGEIIDLQSRFNLNNLKTQPGRKQFRALITQLNPGLEKSKAQTITRGAWYWQNSYKAGRGQDTFMDSFLKNTPPTLPSHLPFSSISELRLIPGMNAKIMIKLIPYITALPGTTAININTASKLILKTMGDEFTSSVVDKIIKERLDKPIDSVITLLKLLGPNNIMHDNIAFSSDYFLIIARVKGSDKTFVNYSLIKRSRDKKYKRKYRVHLLRESFNSL